MIDSRNRSSSRSPSAESTEKAFRPFPIRQKRGEGVHGSVGLKNAVSFFKVLDNLMNIIVG